MKKTLMLAIALTVPAMAGTPSPVVAGPNPDIVPTPVAAPSPWAMEIGAVYRSATEDIVDVPAGLPGSDEVDLWGLDVTGIYKITDNHAVTLRVGYNYGDGSMTRHQNYGPDEDEYLKYGSDVDTVYIMPGYRYTDTITDNISWYAGANVGLAHMKIKGSLDYYGPIVNEPVHDSETDKDWGFAASAELGLQYHINDCVYLYGAYQFMMSNAEPGLNDFKVEKQRYHSVTAGVGINF